MKRSLSILLVVMLILAVAVSKITLAIGCPDYSNTQSFTAANLKQTWYKIQVDRFNLETSCPAQKYTDSNSIFAAEWASSLIGLIPISTQGMLKCDTTTGKCFLNFWYWLDTNMDQATNFIIISLDSTTLITYKCQIAWWFLGLAIEEQVEISSTSTSMTYA